MELELGHCEYLSEKKRRHLDAAPPTTILRMVTILLECGLRIGEPCLLPLECLSCDDKHERYLRLYQRKFSKEHIIPLVDEKVVETIQAQQQEIRNRWGNTCLYLFPYLCGATIDERALPLLKQRLQEEQAQVPLLDTRGYVRLREKSEQMVVALLPLLTALEAPGREGRKQ